MLTIEKLAVDLYRVWFRAYYGPIVTADDFSTLSPAIREVWMAVANEARSQFAPNDNEGTVTPIRKAAPRKTTPRKDAVKAATAPAGAPE